MRLNWMRWHKGWGDDEGSREIQNDIAKAEAFFSRKEFF